MITWILSLLPEWFWSFVLIMGVLGILVSWVLKFIPFISTYKLPIQVISILMLLLGVYFQGVYANEEKYKAEHQKISAHIARQEAEFKVINAELALIQAERDAAIADRGEKSKQTITRWLKEDPKIIVKEIDLSESERKILEEKIQELQKAEKECKVPALLIEELNNNAVRPLTEDKK
jgi:hypothetical protein